jgi:hypothetical protein
MLRRGAVRGFLRSSQRCPSSVVAQRTRLSEVTESGNARRCNPRRVGGEQRRAVRARVTEKDAGQSRRLVAIEAARVDVNATRRPSAETVGCVDIPSAERPLAPLARLTREVRPVRRSCSQTLEWSVLGRPLRPAGREAKTTYRPVVRWQGRRRRRRAAADHLCRIPLQIPHEDA